MDVLLQRIGRLHRHKLSPDGTPKARPAGYETPKVIVMTHEDQTFESLINDSGEVNGSAKKLGLGSVYADMRIIRLTRDILAGKKEFTIPDDNRYLVERATHPERLDSLTGKKWKAHGQKIEGITGAQGVMADLVTLKNIMRKDFGEELFGSLDRKAATRLGVNDIRVKFSEPVTSPFGKQIAEMVMPGYWFKGERDPSSDTATVSHDNDSLVFEYEGVKCRYSRHGLEKKE
jgi:CRISPR-associated endonuclease/helicase Cas3